MRMLQGTAWLCIQAQTELAHRTNTLPQADSYAALMNVIEPKVKEYDLHTVNIHEHLQTRGIRVFAPESNSPNASFNASASDCCPPTVVFLCDIEGTTTPLPFVRKVMMPLAAANVEAYAAAHFPSDAAFVQHVRDAAAFAATATADPDAPSAPTLGEALEKSEAAKFSDETANTRVRALFCHHFRQEVEKGSREAYMKAVEGAIWEEVYAKGQHQTQVFPDVNEFFRFAGDESTNTSMHIALYSTGSVAAQKLLMKYTPYGDLNPFITAYFDPATVGTKLMPKSYMRIRNTLAEQLKIASPEQLQIVFLTDNTSEASAADASGAVDCPVLCMRPYNEWIKVDTMLSVSVPFITSFSQLLRPEGTVDYDQIVREAEVAMKDKEV